MKSPDVQAISISASICILSAILNSADSKISPDISIDRVPGSCPSPSFVIIIISYRVRHSEIGEFKVVIEERAALFLYLREEEGDDLIDIRWKAVRSQDALQNG